MSAGDPGRRAPEGDDEIGRLGAAFNDMLGRLEQSLKIRYAFVHMPIEARHKNAFHASKAAACAGDQNQYWPMHHRLFANQGALAPIHLPIPAQALNLKLDQFKTCLDSGRYAPEIRRDPGSLTLRVSAKLTGAKSFAALKGAIDPLIAAAATNAPR